MSEHHYLQKSLQEPPANTHKLYPSVSWCRDGRLGSLDGCIAVAPSPSLCTIVRKLDDVNKSCFRCVAVMLNIHSPILPMTKSIWYMTNTHGHKVRCSF